MKKKTFRLVFMSALAFLAIVIPSLVIIFLELTKYEVLPGFLLQTGRLLFIIGFISGIVFLGIIGFKKIRATNVHLSIKIIFTILIVIFFIGLAKVTLDMVMIFYNRI
jgi:hypothetical protein